MSLVDYMKDAIVVVGFVTVVIGALGAAYRKGAKPALVELRAIREVTDLQLRANGGGSLVDNMALIRPNHAAAEQHWTELTAAQQEIKKVLEERTDVTAERFTQVAAAHAAIQATLDERTHRFDELAKAQAETMQIIVERGVQIARIDSKLTSVAEEQAEIRDLMTQRDARIEIIDAKVTTLTTGQSEIRDIAESHTARLDKIEGAVVKP